MDHESSPARVRRPPSDHVSLSDRDSSLDPDQRAQGVTVPLDPALFPSTSTTIKAQDATAHPIAQSLASKAAPPPVPPSTSAFDPPTAASMLPFSGWQWLTLIVLIGCTYTMASAASSSSSPTSSSSTQIRIASWNLRYDSMPNNITVQQTLASLADPLQQPAFFNLTGEQPWSTRRIKVAQRLLSENIVLAGFQEGLVRQVHDLAELLGDGWGWFGVGRDDGVDAGEFSPIFYQKSTFDLLSNDTFWLSNTPFVPGSKFPGAGSVRIATAVRLRARATGTLFTYLNTHLDDQSDAQRRLGASLILWRARFEAAQGGSGRGLVLVTGDFNSPSTGTDSGAYNIITGALPPVAINQTFVDRYPIPSKVLPNFTAIDLRTRVSRFAASGNFATYTGFVAPQDASQYTHIDFVFGGSNGGWTGDAFKVETALTDDGVLASDHRPVFGDITLL